MECFVGEDALGQQNDEEFSQRGWNGYGLGGDRQTGKPKHCVVSDRGGPNRKKRSNGPDTPKRCGMRGRGGFRKKGTPQQPSGQV